MPNLPLDIAGLLYKHLKKPTTAVFWGSEHYSWVTDSRQAGKQAEKHRQAFTNTYQFKHLRPFATAWQLKQKAEVSVACLPACLQLKEMYPKQRRIPQALEVV